VTSGNHPTFAFKSRIGRTSIDHRIIKIAFIRLPTALSK
jgi:hypothetical protein